MWSMIECMPQPICALYYPHIQFRSLGWIKAALLYWEGVKRIVPEGLDPKDPPEVLELLAEGLIENVAPSEALRAQAARRFRLRLDSLIASRGNRAPWVLDELRNESQQNASGH